MCGIEKAIFFIGCGFSRKKNKVIAIVNVVSKGNSFIVNDKQFQKGALSWNLNKFPIIQIGTLSTTLEDLTVDGQKFTTKDQLQTWADANVFKTGGGSGGGAVESVTGNLVNGTATNPVVDLPEWVNYCRVDRVGAINVPDMTITYQVGAPSVDATDFISSWHTTIDELILQFPKLTDVPFKRHVLFFNINITTVTPTPIGGALINGIPTEARKGDIWVLTYDRFSNNWHLESCNSVPKWWIEDNFINISDTSMMPEAGKIPIFSSQGLLSTGTPLFPENAVPLAYLDIKFRGYDTIVDVTENRVLSTNDAGFGKALVINGTDLVMSLPNTVAGFTAGNVINLFNINSTPVEISNTGSIFNIVSNGDLKHISDKAYARLVYLGNNNFFLEGELTAI